MQEAPGIPIEDRATEQECQRHFASLKAEEILGRRDIEIEAAWDRQFDDALAVEGRHLDVRVRPKHAL